MKPITIDLTGNNSIKALKELEEKSLIRIVNEPDLNSYALAGNSISREDFKKWVEFNENSPTVSITEAKQRWTIQKEKLQNPMH